MKETNEVISSPWISGNFTDQQVQYLSQGCQEYAYDEGESIVWKDDKNEYIYLVNKGVAEIKIMNQDGFEKTVMMARSGNILAEISAILKKESYMFAVAGSRCQVFKIPVKTLMKRLINEEDMLMSFMTQIAIKSHVLLNQISMLTFDSPTKRVEKFLLMVFEQFGIKKDGGIYLDKKIGNTNLTHQYIADMTGLSRVSVSNTFRDLYAEDILMKESGGYFIQSLDDLR